MKVMFISNYFNHHQKPFSDAMYEHLKEGYVFIETDKIGEERLKLGWGISQKPTYVYHYNDHTAQCDQWIREADVVIFGSAPQGLLSERLQNGKLTFRYSERLLKRGPELWKYPLRWYRRHRENPRKANLYLLCASAYAAADFQSFGCFRNRCYKWGYFPEVKQYEDIDELIKLKRPASILWCARLIDWKHPELPILIAKRLKEEKYSFEMNLIGNGILEDKLRSMIRELGLEDCVHMLGSMKPNQVREYMEQSQIFLFTSDRNEGWGAVLNEAMNSACGVIASHAIGSAPYLIRHGENAMLYRDGHFDDIYEKVKLLLDDPQKAACMGKKAYEAMTDEWNAHAASERLLTLCEELLHGRSGAMLYESGPCSRAENMKDGWFKE